MTSIQHRREGRAGGRAWFGGFIALGLGLVAAGLLAPHAFGQSGGQSGETRRDTVTLEGRQTDVQFLAGRTVRVNATLTDDLFAAGRDVILDTSTLRNAIVAGYDVEQRGGSAADMLVAASNLNIAGSIEDDLVAGVRALRVFSGATIGGDVRVAAETIDMEGRIGGNLRAAARRITIAGEVAGKADLFAQRIVIAPGAVINGDLIYRGGAEPEIAPGATITGEVRKVELDMPDLRSIVLAILCVVLVILLAWAIAMLLLVIIVQLAFPEFMADAVERVRTQPLSNLGLGIVILLLAGLLSALLFGSIVGIPIGGALATALVVLWVLGVVTASYAIGLVVRRWVRGPVIDVRQAGRVSWALLGAFILFLVALVPLIGMLAAWLAVAAGFGAAAAELWMRLRAD